MKRQNTRLNKLEQESPAVEPVFMVWLGQGSWMPKEKATATRQNPGCPLFWRPLLCGSGTTGRGNRKNNGAEIVLNYQPHPAQMQIHQARAYRFRTVCTGRRFGKTLCLAAELLDRGGCDPASPSELAQAGCAGAMRGREYGWVAPTYNVAERGIEAFRAIAGDFVRICGRGPMRVEFTGSAGPVRIWFLSADNPDGLRGYGFNGLVIDEAAAIPVDVWHYALRPTIAQTLGWAVLCSTPNGRNWFYDLHTRGLDPAETDYHGFTFPSQASTFFPAKEWEEAQRTLPADVFRQEYQAEFLEDSAGVFRNIEGCLLPPERCMPADGRHSVIIGCDIAKHTDWTVLIAMDAETGRCFAKDRFNMLDWPIQRERIVSFARGHRGRLILDATGVGDPVFDDLKRTLSDIEGVRLSPSVKTSLIQRLMVAVEQRKVSWPAAWEDLIAEMRRYEYRVMPNGAVQYDAPSGHHDDCVVALALANHRRWESEYVGTMRAFAPAWRHGSGWARRSRTLD
jgi:hypothetical protein